MLLYKIRFDAAPTEILFELRQKQSVSVRDVIRVMNDNFKSMNFEVTFDSKTLDEKDNVQDDRTYIVKCKQEKKKTRKSFFKYKILNYNITLFNNVHDSCHFQSSIILHKFFVLFIGN